MIYIIILVYDCLLYHIPQLTEVVCHSHSYLLMPPTATPTAEVMLMVVVHRLDRRLEMLSLESDVYQNR